MFEVVQFKVHLFYCTLGIIMETNDDIPKRELIIARNGFFALSNVFTSF